MATNRTLLVRDWFAFPSRLGELFTAPAGLRGWEGLSYERVTTRLEAAGVGAAELRASAAVVTLLEENAQRHVLRGARRAFASDHMVLLCDDFARRMPHRARTPDQQVCYSRVRPLPWTGYPQPFVHVLSNTYFAPLLLRNRRHATLAAALGPRPFRRLARYLLRPAAPVAADVDAFLLARRRGTLAAPDVPDAPADAPTDADAPADAPPPRPLMGMHARTQDWMRVPLEAYWGCMLRRTLKSGTDPWIMVKVPGLG